MTVPHITIEQMEFIVQPWTNTAASVAEINTRIDAYNEKQSQEQYITPEEARKRPLQDVDWYHSEDGWITPTAWHIYSDNRKYRLAWHVKHPATEHAQPGSVPAVPHAELKAMYEQQVKDGTLDNFVWEFTRVGCNWAKIVFEIGTFFEYNEYRCTPKPTCQIKNLDTGELKTMTREKAKLLQAELGNTVMWMLGGEDMSAWELSLEFDSRDTYTYKADCLNGGEHQLKLSKTWPKKFAKMRCKDCDYERQPTAEENPL